MNLFIIISKALQTFVDSCYLEFNRYLLLLEDHLGHFVNYRFFTIKGLSLVFYSLTITSFFERFLTSMKIILVSSIDHLHHSLDLCLIPGSLNF